MIADRTGTMDIADRILIFCISIYVCMMFLTMGEAIRNILLSVSFIAWLYTLRQRDLSVLKSPVAVFFWLYCASILLSTAFSIDRPYSLSQLSGEPRKALMLFPMLATTIDTEKKAKLVLHAMVLSALIVTGLGYFTFMFARNASGLPGLTAYVGLMHVGSEKYGGIMLYLLPFICAGIYVQRTALKKALLAVAALAGLMALLLSGARAAFLAFFLVCLFLVILVIRQNWKRGIRLAGFLAAVSVAIATVSLVLSPQLLSKVKNLPGDLSTASNRSVAWSAAWHGFQQKPLLGWGYGKKIFEYEEPFRDTPMKKPPRFGSARYDDPHNTFLMILFHQGILGFVSYSWMIATALWLFCSRYSGSQRITGAVVITSAAAILGTYVIYAQFSYVKLHYLAMLAGMGTGLIGRNAGNRE